MKDTHIRKSLDDGLSALSYTEQQHREMLNRIVYGGKSKVKKKASFSIALAVVLALVTITGALAATGAFEKIMEVWQNSFEKMNTTNELLELVDEEEYAQLMEDKGKEGIKEDYVVSTVPRTGDLDYDSAYAIARQAILDTFGTPEAELDAMGVYPYFFNTPYIDAPDEEDWYTNEWEFYFTPRRDADVEADHTYDAPGEYRVWLASPSGEVTNIIWYLDGFWPDYALRTWNAGKQDYVYNRALGDNAFYQMPREEQQKFLELFEEAGYDLKPLDKDLITLLNETRWFLLWENADNLLDTDTLAVRAVVEAMEANYGFSRDMLKKYCFLMLPSPLPSDTEDYCLVFDHNLIYREEQNPDNPTGGVGQYELEAVQYLQRLGYFLVRLNPESLEAVETIHAPWLNRYGTANYSKKDAQMAESDGLLGRKNWTTADLTEFEALLSQLAAIDAAVQQGEISSCEGERQFLALMLQYGGDPATYKPENRSVVSNDTADTAISEAQAREMALAAVAERLGKSVEEVQRIYPRVYTSYYRENRIDYWYITVWTDKDAADTPNADVLPEFWVTITVPDGKVTVGEIEGNG
ncbi:MAG: hypothetical protein IKN04_03740 [Clostridia bacterium]|nr:hypothetical protein [Clostridia bacterium]